MKALALAFSLLCLAGTASATGYSQASAGVGMGAQVGRPTLIARQRQGFFSRIWNNWRARRSFKKWLKQSGNEDLRAFNRGALKDEHVGLAKFTHVIGNVAAVLNAAAFVITQNPVNAVLVGTTAVAAQVAKMNARRGTMRANTQTVRMALSQPGMNVDMEQLQKWVNAGLVHEDVLAE